MIELQDPNSHPPIYCDLDGVYFDFEMGLIQHYGIEPNRVTDDQLWEAIADHEAREGAEWFMDLPLMPKAMELWRYLRPYKPTILTATGRNGIIHAPQKVRICQQVFGGITPDRVITVRRSEDKAAWAANGAIIIDDNFERVIKTWETAGGIGIHHIHTDRTIMLFEQLRDNGWKRRPFYPISRITR